MFYNYSGRIIGAKTSEYLLEKSRIVTQVNFSVILSSLMKCMLMYPLVYIIIYAVHSKFGSYIKNNLKFSWR